MSILNLQRNGEPELGSHVELILRVLQWDRNQGYIPVNPLHDSGEREQTDGVASGLNKYIQIGVDKKPQPSSAPENKSKIC